MILPAVLIVPMAKKNRGNKIGDKNTPTAIPAKNFILFPLERLMCNHNSMATHNVKCLY